MKRNVKGTLVTNSFHLLSHHSLLEYWITAPVDTGRKLNYIRRPGRLLNVLCTFNLRPVSTGAAYIFLIDGLKWTGWNSDKS